VTEDKGARRNVIQVGPILDYFQARVFQELITGGPPGSTWRALEKQGRHTVFLLAGKGLKVEYLAICQN